MAVTPKKIEERLLVKFPKASNLSKARKATITASLAKQPADDADDDAIDAIIEQYNEVFNFEELARQDDALRTMKAKLDAQGNDDKKDDKEDDDKKEDKKDDNVPDYVQKMFDKLETVTTELSEIKKGKVTETKLEKAKDLFAKSKVLSKLPEKVQERYRRTLNLEDAENSIEDQIAEMEAENEDFLQTIVDNRDFAGGPPAQTGSGKPTDAEVDEIIASAGR